MRTLLKHLVIVLLTVTAVVAQAQPGKGNGAGNSGKGSVNVQSDVSIDIGITVGQARDIAVDLGLTGYDGLPPGIAKMSDVAKRCLRALRNNTRRRVCWVDCLKWKITNGKSVAKTWFW